MTKQATASGNERKEGTVTLKMTEVINGKDISIKFVFDSVNDIPDGIMQRGIQSLQAYREEIDSFRYYTSKQ